MQTANIMSEVEKLRDEMVQTLMELVRIPAMSPESGGEGESSKAEKLIQILREHGFDKIERHDAEDAHAPSGKRPNIIAYWEGEKTAERLFIVTHMDVVPPGEESLWKITKPFEPILRDGRVYGRGSEDNMQSVVASIFALKALRNLGIKPSRTAALCFVADEEQGSTYGIKHLIRQNMFRQNDLVVVPDGGNHDGSFVEIAEKSVLWLKIRTSGKQAHGSEPKKGLNANRAGMQFALTLDKLLHEKYAAIDESFDPPESTFEPTAKEKNVDAVNIIPGEDVVCFDCRILPAYNVEDVLADVNATAAEIAQKTGAKIKVEIVQKMVAPKPTDPSSPIVLLLTEALKKARGTQPKIGGIGGGTCAAYFRKAGIPAVVWSTVGDVAHQPDEFASVDNLVNDAKVFALLAAL